MSLSNIGTHEWMHVVLLGSGPRHINTNIKAQEYNVKYWYTRIDSTIRIGSKTG